MTTRTFADNTRPPIINTVTIKHFSKLDFQSKREVDNGRPMPELKCMCGSGAWSASAAGGREWGWGSGIGARERVIS